MMSEEYSPSEKSMELWKDFKGQVLSETLCDMQSISLLPVTDIFNSSYHTAATWSSLDEQLSQREDLHLLKVIQNFEKYRFCRIKAFCENCLLDVSTLKVLGLFCDWNESDLSYFAKFFKISDNHDCTSDKLFEEGFSTNIHDEKSTKTVQDIENYSSDQSTNAYQPCTKSSKTNFVQKEPTTLQIEAKQHHNRPNTRHSKRNTPSTKFTKRTFAELNLCHDEPKTRSRKSNSISDDSNPNGLLDGNTISDCDKSLTNGLGNESQHTLQQIASFSSDSISFARNQAPSANSICGNDANTNIEGDNLRELSAKKFKGTVETVDDAGPSQFSCSRSPCIETVTQDQVDDCEHLSHIDRKESVQLQNYSNVATRKSFSCIHCNQQFTHKTQLKLHLKRTHSQSFKCDLCNSSFSQSNQLQKHMRSHTGERPYICDVCGKGFTQSSNLRSHARKHIGERPFSCHLCPFVTAHSSNLKVHIKSHTGEKTHVCEMCGASFADSARLKRHVMVHTGEKPLSCEVCGTRFADKSHLNVHMRIHSGDKPFQCTICSAAFRESSKLRTHSRIHTGEKPFICEVCGATFAVAYGLKSHMRRHTGEKPYKCQICGFATSHSSNLKSHMMVHTATRPYACTECGASFRERSKLQRHQKVHCDMDEEDEVVESSSVGLKTGPMTKNNDVSGEAYQGNNNFMYNSDHSITTDRQDSLDGIGRAQHSVMRPQFVPNSGRPVSEDSVHSISPANSLPVYHFEKEEFVEERSYDFMTSYKPGGSSDSEKLVDTMTMANRSLFDFPRSELVAGGRAYDLDFERYEANRTGVKYPTGLDQDPGTTSLRQHQAYRYQFLNQIGEPQHSTDRVGNFAASSHSHEYRDW